MSEQEKKGIGGTKKSAIVMVEQTGSHVKPYRPTEIEQDTDLHHKRSRAPAMPSVENLKNIVEDVPTSQIYDSKELKDNEPMSSERKHTVSKKSSKRRDLSPDIELRTLGDDTKRDNAPSKVLQQKFMPPTQRIPPQIQEEKTGSPVLQNKTDEVNKKVEEDSITQEITELQTSEEVKEHSEWSDDEEASGLPRSESRASRVSRAVRQLFCCGVRYEAASEDNISTRSGYNHGI